MFLLKKRVIRIGQAGQVELGKTGLALTMVSPADQKRWQEIHDYAFDDSHELTEVFTPNERAVTSGQGNF